MPALSFAKQASGLLGFFIGKKGANSMQKIFSYLCTTQGKQAFYRRYSDFILGKQTDAPQCTRQGALHIMKRPVKRADGRKLRRHGEYLFSLTDSIDNFHTEKTIRYRDAVQSDTVRIYFFAKKFSLGVIAMTPYGNETFIEL